MYIRPTRPIKTITKHKDSRLRVNFKLYIIMIIMSPETVYRYLQGQKSIEGRDKIS
jgi:hypothetical protein